MDLLIIDEISMVSNIILLYTHLRLTELFNTSEKENGWFGGMNVLLFSYLLPLRPAKSEFDLKPLSDANIRKYLNCINVKENLWDKFDYDELTINMRQKADIEYGDLLNRLRIGIVNNQDIKLLQTRKLTFISTNIHDRLNELSDYITSLPSETLCLLPTLDMSKILNDKMLSEIQREEILVTAVDNYEGIFVIVKGYFSNFPS